jgi:hypothetical protein
MDSFIFDKILILFSVSNGKIVLDKTLPTVSREVTPLEPASQEA